MSEMKVSIYFGDLNRPLDASHPDLGNPGVGGTQYCMLLLAYYLNVYAKHIAVNIISESPLTLPDGINYVRTDPYNYVHEAERIGSDILIVKGNADQREQDALAKTKMKVIVWGHNYYFAEYSKWVSQTDSIKANVFVGKQQYDRYIDHDIIMKSKTIFNMLPDFLGDDVIRCNDGRTVVYMGALIPAKGFLQMARMWKTIVEAVPDASLLVMGTGTLYSDSKSAHLGPLGVADADFEKQFLPYLTDANGELLPSVKFLGRVGVEKYDYFMNASVGVVNPSGRTETFGMGVIEMATAKLPVVTINTNAYPDVVVDGCTGFLGNTQNEIAGKIIKLLQDRTLNEKFGEAAKKRAAEFAPESIIYQWIELLDNVYNHVEPLSIKYSKPVPPFSNNFKWIRCTIRFFRKTMHLKFIPALIDIESWVRSFLK